MNGCQQLLFHIIRHDQDQSIYDDSTRAEDG